MENYLNLGDRTAALVPTSGEDKSKEWGELTDTEEEEDDEVIVIEVPKPLGKE